MPATFDRGTTPGATHEGGLVDKAKDAASSVADKAKDLASAVGDKASQAKDKLQHWGSDAGDAVSHAAEKAQEWGSDAAHAVSDQARKAGDELTSLIRRYPVPALFIGFGLGMLMARAMRA
jgi:hypothetical protein